ncbi:general substrate transporter [Lipomyces chichibuensis]|uniref:general substrate transporter n=1 Tax=Lipomyces chichibuensis TaxID=1546026 RepID=UPI003343D02D
MGADAKFMKLQGASLQLAQTLLVVAPAFILFGYNMSGIGGLLNLPSWVKQFPEIDAVDAKGHEKFHKSTIQGTIVATFTLGALFGSLSCTWIGEPLGRRRIIFAGACLVAIGDALECSALSLAQFTVGRVIIGWGIGLLSATVPVWVSECSSALNRGRHVVVVGLFMAAGMTICNWVNYGFYHMEHKIVAWKAPLGIPIFFALIIIFSVFFLPESPRWLVLKNRSDTARYVLASLKGLDIDSSEVLAEVNGIELSLEDTASNAASLKDIFTMGEERLFYRFMLCMGLQFFQQMTGGTLITVYIPIIFQDMKLSADLSKILAASAMTWKFLSCFVAFFTIDRFGRRIAFMVSGAGMSLCMVAMAVATSFTGNHSANIAAAFFVFLYLFFLPIGFLGANFLYTTEIAPGRLRVAMQSISTANHWLWMFVVTMITPVAVANIGYRYYIVYVVVGAIIPPVVYFYYPETMNRNLEQLDLIFREAPTIMSIVSMSKKLPQGEAEIGSSEKETEVFAEQVEKTEDVEDYNYS